MNDISLLKQTERIIFITVLLMLMCLCTVPLYGQWNVVDAGTFGQLEAVYAIDSNTVLIAGKDGVLRRTADGGATWTSPSTGYFDDLNAFAFEDASTGYLAADDGAVLKTTDAGLTWSILSTGGSAENQGIDWQAGTVIVCGEAGSLYRSTDGGASWTYEGGSAFVDLQDRAFSPAGQDIAVGDGGTVLANASTLYTDAPGFDLEAVAFAASGEAYAAGKNGRVLRSTDAGLSWTAMTGVGFDVEDLWLETADRFYACGDGGSIHRTDDGGTSWSAMTTPVFAELSAIHFSDPQHGWAVGDAGTVLKLTLSGIVDTTGSDTTGTDTTGTDTTATALALIRLPDAHVWPNPFTRYLDVDPGRNTTGVYVDLVGLDGRHWGHWDVTATGRRVQVPEMLPEGFYQLIWSDANNRRVRADALMHLHR